MAGIKAWFLIVLLMAGALFLLALAGPAGKGASDALSNIALPASSDVMLSAASAEERAFGMSLIAALPKVELTSDHADKTHPEAKLVRKTCIERGVYQVWREKMDKSTFHILCMTVDGKLVDWIITVVGSKFIEKTAFMPRGGMVNKVINYVSGKATRFEKGW